MHKKRSLVLILVLLTLFMISGTSSAVSTSANDSGNTIFLRTATINTDQLLDEEGEEISVSSNSIEETVADTEQYYIVQFNEPVFKEQKEEITQLGAVLYDYLPDNAFIVKMNPSVRSQVSSLEFVKWIGEYKPSYKYEPAITAAANQLMSEPITETDDLLVLLFDASDISLISEEIAEIGGTVTESSNNIMRIEIAKSRINDLAAINGISWIEEYREPVLSNDVAATIIGVTPVHDTHGLNGSGQIVAVCDTGVDTGIDDESMHADIRGRILNIIDLSGDGAADDAPLIYKGGHGTHVTGSVLGNGEMSGGLYNGMAPAASLVFEAFQNSDGSLYLPYYINESVFQPAYDLDARIHSNSWGYQDNYGNYSIYSQQVDQFMWDNPDMLIMFAAGNYGVDQDKDGVVDQNSIQDPATAKNCIAVGSSETYREEFINDLNLWGSKYVYPISSDYKTDNIEGIAASSGRGPTNDGRIKPDVVAPGTATWSTKSSFLAGDRDYALMGGTSMATPIVAGSAALIRQYYNDIEGLSNPSAALLKATLINGAHDMTPGQYGTGDYKEISGRPDYSQGWGRIDVENSLFSQYPDVIAYFDKETIDYTGDFWEFNCDYLLENEPLRATLVWTDYPGSVASEIALVNNLDLTITDSDDTYYGNGAPDTINNVEGVEIDETVAGDYSIRVDGTNIPKGPQDFALVLSLTCDNNKFPENGSSTDDGTTVVSTDVVHPGGVDKSSIVMKINGSSVGFNAVEIDGGYRIYYDTPVTYQNGEYNVSVSAQTDSGQQFSYNWKFNMNASPVTNYPPVLDSIGPKTVGEGNLLSITLSANDNDGDSLTYYTNATFGTLMNNVFEWTPNYDDAGTYSVNFSVTDGINADSEIITITVANVDQPPVLDPIGSKTTTENQPLNFTISATDPDGTDVTYSAENLPIGATLNDTTGYFDWTPGYDSESNYNVKFIAISNGLEDNETISITVANSNRAPALDTIGDRTVLENNLLVIELSANDLDGDYLTFATNATFGTFDGASFIWTPGYDNSGVYPVEFNVTDGKAVDSEIIIITVTDSNRAPELAAIGDKTVAENELLSITLSSSDADGDSLTYSTNATFGTLADNVFTWTPDYEDQGSYSVEFSVTDGLAVDKEIIKITVTNSNRAPVMDVIDDKIVNENELLSIAFIATDDDGDSLTYSTNATFGTLTNDVYEWIPDYDDAGTYSVEFSVTDGIDIDSEIITITVSNINRAPVLSEIGPQSVNENEELSIKLSSEDLDNDELSYATNATFGSLADNIFTWTPGYDDSGIYYVKFNVTDGFAIDKETITIIVINSNRAPVFDPIGDKTGSEGNLLTITLTANDYDEDSLTYSTNATFGTLEDNVFTWTPAYDDSGTYYVEFTVSDGEETDSEVVKITVTDLDQAPVLDPIGYKTAIENKSLNFTIYAEDRDGTPVTYSAENLPSGATLDEKTGYFEWTPDYDSQSSYDVKFIATSNGLESNETITINVVDVDQTPVLTSIGDKTATENQSLNFTIYAEDPDGTTVTYSAENLPDGATLDETTGYFDWTPGYDSETSYDVTLIATSSGLEDNETITITVTNCNRAPELAAIGDRTILENDNLFIALSATDLDGDDLTFATNTTLGTFDGQNFNWTPKYDDSGVYYVEFNVTDGTDVDSETISITVRDKIFMLAEPVSFSNTTGNFWVFHDWEAGSGNITDSYNVSYDGTWSNGTASEFNHTSLGPHAWSNITVYAYNATTSTLSSGVVDNVQVPNNPVTINDVGSSVSRSEGMNIHIDANFTDLDGDTATFSCNRTDLFSDFNSATGEGSWVANYSSNGTYHVEFGVSDGYGSSNSQIMVITINNVNAPPEFEYISPKTIEITRNLQLTINATDDDNDTLVYSNTSALPTGATFNITTLLFNWTPTTDQEGIYYVNFTVNDGEDSDNLTVQITVKELATATTPTTSSSSGGGGGGGGGTTGEEYENIELKDVSSLFVGKDTVVRFDFNNPGLDIMYVEYTSLKNAGTISVTIESLKDKSSFADSLPAGEIYKNINIWVGKTGYAIDANLENPVIAFRVGRDWIREEGIDEASIALNRYSDGSWNRLSTDIVDSDEDFLYFEARTPGFSPFAITGNKVQGKIKLDDSPETLYSTEDAETEKNSSAGQKNESEAERTLNFISALINGLIICFACFLVRRQ